MCSSDINISVKGCTLFIVSCLYMLSNVQKPKQTETNSKMEHKDQVKEIVAKKIRHDDDPQTLSEEKFPWEAEVNRAHLTPIKCPIPFTGPFICTFITENNEETMEEKMAAVARMTHYKGKFNVACPCCQ